MSDVLTSEAVIHTHEMVVIHRAFRRESRLLCEFVGAVPDGNSERAAILGRHLAWYEVGLTNHHEGEDELLGHCSISAPALRRRSWPAWNDSMLRSLSPLQRC